MTATSNPAPAPVLQAGQNFMDWQIVARLGSGAFGEVFKIKNKKGQICALKTERVDADCNVSFKLLPKFIAKLLQHSHFFLRS
jgi:hypothetical protein